MLLISVLLASMTGPSAAGPSCAYSAIRSVTRDRESAAPILLTTASGSRYRILGNDFIHSDRWKAGERLRLCTRPEDIYTIVISDVDRGEDVVGLRRDAPSR